MTMQDVATAMQRAEAALQRRPDLGPHKDAAATAAWQPGVKVAGLETAITA